VPAILEGVTHVLSSTVVGQISLATELKPEVVSQGIGIVTPLIVAALANKVALPRGVDALMQVLPRDGGLKLRNVDQLARGGGAASAVRVWIFRSEAAAVGATVDRAVGYRASALFGIAGPMVLLVLGRIAHDRKLDADGVAHLLNVESAEFQRAGGERARLVREALDAGTKAADVKARYSSEEWQVMRLAPVAAAHIVAIDRSSTIPVTTEIRTATEVIDTARKLAPPTSVLSLAFESDLTLDEMSQLRTHRTRADAVATLDGALDAILRHSPADAPRFRRVVDEISSRIGSVLQRETALSPERTVGALADRSRLDLATRVAASDPAITAASHNVPFGSGVA
jgi:hypothetical protein